MNVLVTGASGFIGTPLVRNLLKAGHAVRGAARDSSAGPETGNGPEPDYVRFDLSGSDNDYRRLLSGIDVVIHLAARVHQTAESAGEGDLYGILNVEGTRSLLSHGVKNGIRRFVFLSTIKVVGEGNAAHGLPGDKGYSEEDIPDPHGHYAESKYAAEQLIQELCATHDAEYVILRPPLVYGPGVKGNFLSLMHAVYKHYPLPLAGVKNKRSLIYVENLCGGIIACVDHPAAAGNIFHISDVTVSVPELIRKIAYYMGTKPMIFPIPVALMNVVAGVFNRKEMIDRLAGSLVVDDSRIRNLLSWSPEYSFDDAVDQTVRWYLNRK